MKLTSCLLASVAMTFSTLAAGASEYVSVKTEMGCSVFVSKAMLDYEVRSKKSTSRRWYGECINGLASGRGTLILNSTSGEGERISKVTRSTEGRMIGGKFYGYVKAVSRIEFTGSNSELSRTLPTAYSFNFDDEVVVFDGLGLEVDESLFTDSQPKLPRRASSFSAPYVGIFLSSMGKFIDPAR